MNTDPVGQRQQTPGVPAGSGAVRAAGGGAPDGRSLRDGRLGEDAGVEIAGEGAVAVMPPMRQRVAKFLIRAGLLGLAVSLGVHLVGLLLAAIITFGGGLGGGGGQGGGLGEVEAALGSEGSLEAAAGNIELPGEVTASLADIGDESVQLSDAELVEGAVGQQGVAGLEGLGGLGGAGSVGAGGDGEGLGLGGAGGSGAGFFGVEARGSRFAYIVDISASMVEQDKIAGMKRELARSIEELMEHCSFFVSPYESEAFALGDEVKWYAANADVKRWARLKIADLIARGGTNPAPAFEFVLRDLKPRPDAIYFMTDGEFDREVAQQVADLNRLGRKVPIHCIAFITRDSEDLLRKIASESGGTYTYVAGPRP